LEKTWKNETWMMDFEGRKKKMWGELKAKIGEKTI
jgi:hypothetical protein